MAVAYPTTAYPIKSTNKRIHPPLLPSSTQPTQPSASSSAIQTPPSALRILIENDHVFAVSQNKRFRIEIFEGARDITQRVLKSDRGAVEKLAGKVCNLIQEKGPLRSGEVQFNQENIEITTHDRSITKKTDYTQEVIDLVTPVEDIARNIAYSSSNNPVEIDGSGNCMPASLLHQMLQVSDPEQSRDDLRGAAKEHASAFIRQPVIDKLKEKDYRDALIKKIKNPEDGSFAEIMNENFVALFTAELTTKDQGVTDWGVLDKLLSLGFKKYIENSLTKNGFEFNFANANEDVLDVMLQFYGAYIDEGQVGKTTHLDNFFLHLFVGIKNAGKKDQDKIAVVIVTDRNPGLGFNSIIHEAPLGDLPKVFFIWYNGHNHYKSLDRNENALQALLRADQDSRLAELIACIDHSLRGVDGVAKFRQELKNLQSIYPSVYGKIQEALRLRDNELTIENVIETLNNAFANGATASIDPRTVLSSELNLNLVNLLQDIRNEIARKAALSVRTPRRAVAPLPASQSIAVVEPPKKTAESPAEEESDEALSPEELAAHIPVPRPYPKSGEALEAEIADVREDEEAIAKKEMEAEKEIRKFRDALNEKITQKTVQTSATKPNFVPSETRSEFIKRVAQKHQLPLDDLEEWMKDDDRFTDDKFAQELP